MYLQELVILNYRSCKQLEIEFHKNEPNIFIGINDCGKTTILKAIGLLLDDKPSFYYLKDNSSKRDFSNSPLVKEEFDAFLIGKQLPILPYSANQTVVIGKFLIEANDIDEDQLTTYSNQLLWAIEKSIEGVLWFAKMFENDSPTVSSFLLCEDAVDTDGEVMQLWSSSATDLNKRIKDLKISSEDIENTNKLGRFSNLEKMRAIYAKNTLEKGWASYKIEKGDKQVFPTFRYLDWNASLEDIKKTATDAMTAKIEAHIKPLKAQATQAAREVEKDINEQLEHLKDSIGDMLPSITGIKTKVYINVQETVTDILINKNNADGDIHLDLQGEGVKRQIWFALIKAGALASIESGMTNKKFIWAFDEPETHLYPSAQRGFFEIINEVSVSNVQTLISTHSTVFIDKSKLKTIRAVALKEDAYSEFFECTTVDEIFESLELRNSDFLFYDKFFVIEGDTEVHLIPGLFKLYTGKTFAEMNIQLINLTGKSKWLDAKRALGNVLSGFKKSFDNVVYLFDADMKFDLGAAARTDKMFFAGKQDIEDSIDSNVWVEFVKKATENKVILTKGEVEAIKDAIPEDVAGSNNQKFYAALEKIVKEKMNESLKEGEEKITWAVLPTKGNDLAQLLLKHIRSIDLVSPEIKSAFETVCPGTVVEVREEVLVSATTE